MIRDFQVFVVSHLGKHQPSSFCTEKFHALCHLRVDTRRYGNMKKLEVGLYESRHFTFKEDYRRTSQWHANCLREGGRGVEYRSMLGDHTMNAVHNGDECSIGSNSKVHSSMASHNKGVTVLVSKYSDLLRHVKEDILYYKEKILKQLQGECKLKFSKNTANLFC